MEVSDFRIGNYINGFYLDDEDCEQKTLCEIVGLDSVGFSEYTFWVYSKAEIKVFQKFEGIPITEEWLLKFGFKKVDKFVKYGNGHDFQPDYPRTILNGFKIEISEDNYFGYFTSEMKWRNKQTDKIESDMGVSIVCGDFYSSYEGSDIIYCVVPEFVHQLQNLYFALTGEELKLKK